MRDAKDGTRDPGAGGATLLVFRKNLVDTNSGVSWQTALVPVVFGLFCLCPFSVILKYSLLSLLTVGRDVAVNVGGIEEHTAGRGRGENVSTGHGSRLALRIQCTNEKSGWIYGSRGPARPCPRRTVYVLALISRALPAL